ncbi:MAG: radical SAM protein [Hadesarchaea archaeon]|nr:radical SAM protein [Hadesarchaea archaeon]
MSGYDPLELSKEVSEKVLEEDERKYYRFRSTKFYGGIATADCVGCNLNCKFCWSEKPRKFPEEIGDFYSPKEVAENLIEIARENDFSQVRISGNEPSIGRAHLISVLDFLRDSKLDFILETNGFLIGNEFEYAQELAGFPNLHVRVSLKGCNAEQYSELTGATPESYKLQLLAVKNLLEAECSCHVSIMKDFASPKELRNLRDRLDGIVSTHSLRLEFEELKLYPHVKKRLRKHDLI